MQLQSPSQFVRCCSSLLLPIPLTCFMLCANQAKDDPYDSTRMKKELPKAMKNLAPGDRVVLMGVSSSPFAADMKALNGMLSRSRHRTCWLCCDDERLPSCSSVDFLSTTEAKCRLKSASSCSSLLLDVDPRLTMKSLITQHAILRISYVWTTTLMQVFIKRSCTCQSQTTAHGCCFGSTYYLSMVASSPHPSTCTPWQRFLVRIASMLASFRISLFWFLQFVLERLEPTQLSSR